MRIFLFKRYSDYVCEIEIKDKNLVDFKNVLSLSKKKIFMERNYKIFYLERDFFNFSNILKS